MEESVAAMEVGETTGKCGEDTWTRRAKRSTVR
jgi:hypothetical protein